MTRKTSRQLALITLAVALATPALAQCIPIPFTRSPVPVINLNAAGCYVVVRNLTTPIQILSDNVTLDLGGNSISLSAGDAIFVNSADNVAIRNGVVQANLDTAISVLDADNVIIEDLRVTAGLYGVLLRDTDNFAVRRLEVRNGQFGIAVDGLSLAQLTGTIEDNVIRYSGNAGIVVEDGSGVAMINNRIRGPGSGLGGDAGIAVQNTTNCMVQQNTIDDTGAGISFFINGTGCTIRDNVISDTQEEGIVLRTGSDDNYVVGNTVTRAAEVGLWIETLRNQVQANVLNDNASFGLEFALGSADNLYRGNTARGNGGTAGTCVISTTDFCDRVTGTTNTDNGDNYMP